MNMLYKIKKEVCPFFCHYPVHPVHPVKSLIAAVLLMVLAFDGLSPLFASELVEAEDGGRNPFSLPKGVFNRAKLSSAAEREKKEKPLVLEAIVTTNANKRLASISGRNVEEGDEISGKKVVEIGKDFVVLSGDLENIRLKLKRQPQAIIVTDETGALKNPASSSLSPELDDQNPETEKNKVLSWVENLKKLK
jgi:hypothetical protein